MAQSGKNTPPHAPASASSQSNQRESKEDEHAPAGNSKLANSEDGNAASQESSTREYGADTPSSTTSDESPVKKPQTLAEVLANIEGVQRDLHCFMATGIVHGGEEISLCFLRAPEDPPITAASLHELDLIRVINNPRLRYDVNFDRELHFRPNTEGAKSKEKIEKADLYWKALQGEVFMYSFLQERLTDPSESKHAAYWTSVLDHCEQRLPKAFDAIRDVIKTLVPDRDQQAVSDRLDSKFLMKQVKNGTCDLADLASWLGKVLKTHCAPMRDNQVDCMVGEIQTGAKYGHVATLVNGLRQLMTVLETMKLDVANHQLRYLRALLVQNTIHFERKYNAYRISHNKIDIVSSGFWFDREMAKTPSGNPLEAISTGLLRDILFNTRAEFYPPTFWLDGDRLIKLRTDMQTSIYQELCRDLLTEVAHSASRPPAKSKLAKALADLRIAITAIIGGSIELVIEDHIENIASEIVRLVHVMEGRDTLSDPKLEAYVEMRLYNELNMTSAVYDKHAQELAERILPRIQTGVKQNVYTPALHLQQRFLPPAPLPVYHHIGMGAVCAPPPPKPPADPEVLFVHKMIHILVLHWQIFGELVYLEEPWDDTDNAPPSSGSRTPPSPDAPRVPMPIARPLWAPGRKWMPIGVTVEDGPIEDPAPGCKTEGSGSSSSKDNDDSDPESTTASTKKDSKDSKDDAPPDN